MDAVDASAQDLAVSQTLAPYDAYPRLWAALLRLVLEEEGSDDFARICRLIRRFRDDEASIVLDRVEVAALLNLDPPLESVLAHTNEPLARLEIEKSIRRIRRKQTRAPRSALTSVAFLLKSIRNKREHGFKAPGRPRDAEILGLAVPVLAVLVSQSLDVARRRGAETGMGAAGR